MSLVTQMNGKHRISVPAHNPVAPGTLRNILQDVAAHAGMSGEELLRLLEL
jgi:hypothetical protein